MNLCEAVKAANGGRVYRKATGAILRFVSGDNFEHTRLLYDLTLEDMTANDWHVVRRFSERDNRHLF